MNERGKSSVDYLANIREKSRSPENIRRALYASGLTPLIVGGIVFLNNPDNVTSRVFGVTTIALYAIFATFLHSTAEKATGLKDVSDKNQK